MREAFHVLHAAVLAADEAEIDAFVGPDGPRGDESRYGEEGGGGGGSLQETTT